MPHGAIPHAQETAAMRCLRHAFTLFTLACLCGGAAVLAQGPGNGVDVAPVPRTAAPPPAKVLPPPFPGVGVIFIANGSGGGNELSEGMRESLRVEKLPFGIDTTRWTLGEGVLPDHRDSERRAEAAAHMAHKIMCFRHANPHARIILMGHSSGTHVVLLAAEMLPPKSIDRIILLATSASHVYDLRGAIRATRSGLDNFFSPDDQVLAWAEDMVGTAERKRNTPIAGRVGFSQIPPQWPEANLYCLLRQYKWDAFDHRYNTGGGHYGWCRPLFLRPYVVPLLMTTEAPLPALPASRTKQ
jgi:pimeloyl-ACP methyl ester carboxylesterase